MQPTKTPTNIRCRGSLDVAGFHFENIRIALDTYEWEGGPVLAGYVLLNDYDAYDLLSLRHHPGLIHLETGESYDIVFLSDANLETLASEQNPGRIFYRVSP